MAGNFGEVARSWLNSRSWLDVYLRPGLHAGTAGGRLSVPTIPVRPGESCVSMLLMGDAGSSTPPGRVVLLNGPPSCGKTSLAAALQRALAEPWFHLSLDAFRAGYPDDRWSADDGTLFEPVMLGYLGSLRQLALAGVDLLAEAVMSPTRRDLYANTFRGLPVVVVGVHCTHDEALRREQRRSDRRGGPMALPVEAFTAVHAGLSYDLEVDTTTSSPESLARQLARKLQELGGAAFAHGVLPIPHAPR